MVDYISVINNYQPKSRLEHEEKEMMLDFIDYMNSSVLYRSSKIAHFTVSGFIINPEKTKTLMVFHNIYKSWSWVGGHCDGNPNLIEVIFKEAMEETGIRDFQLLGQVPISIEILPVFNHLKNNKDIGNHLHLNVTYLLETSEENPFIVNSDENSAIAWLPINQLIHYCNEPHMLKIYDKIIQRVKK